MTVNNGYCTLTEARQNLSINNAANTASDTHIELLINAASRWIDRYTDRRFYGAPETHYYTAEDPCEIFIDDLTAVTALKTDDDGDGVFETTWQASDYQLLPLNAAVKGKPYTRIKTAVNGNHTFPIGLVRAVLVQGQHGYVSGTNAATACPDVIHDATLLLVERLFKRKDAPLGVAGPLGLGVQPVRVPSVTADPDIRDLLSPYRRIV